MNLRRGILSLATTGVSVGQLLCLWVPSAAAQQAVATPKPIPGFQRCPSNLPLAAPASGPTATPEPRAITTAGFDASGNPILATVDAANNRVVVFLTNRSGFSAGDCSGSVSLSAFAVPPGATSIAAADLNADTIVDLAVGVQTGVEILRGDGNGGFTAAANPFPTGSSVTSVAVNEDGPPDINLDGPSDVVAGTLGGNVIVLFGKNSAFDAVDAVDVGGTGGADLAGPVDFVVVKDLNHDGFPDIAAGTSGGEVAVFLQNRAQPRTFLPKITVLTGNFPTSLVADNFTFSEVPDLAITTAEPSGKLTLFRGTKFADGTVAYTAAVPAATGTHPVALASDDFNQDGTLDLVVANKDDGTVSFYLGDGVGGMSEQLGVCRGEPGRCVMGAGPTSTTLTTVDLDGRDDVITANQDEGSISILLSSEVPPLPTNTRTGSPTATGTATPTPGGSCCTAHAGPQCDNSTCQSCVCQLLPSCCDGAWDARCAGLANGNENSGCSPICACGAPTVTATVPPTITMTATAAPTNTPTPTGATPTVTTTPTATLRPGMTATPTFTGTRTPTVTPVVSVTPTATIQQCFGAVCVQGKGCALDAADRSAERNGMWLVTPLLIWAVRRWRAPR